MSREQPPARPFTRKPVHLLEIQPAAAANPFARYVAQDSDAKKSTSIVFFHTINSAHNSLFDGTGLFSKLKNQDKRNINATLVEIDNDGKQGLHLPKVNIYANTRYKGFPSIVFDDNLMMMSYWPANINSNSYNFSVNPDLTTQERMVDMGKWFGENSAKFGINPYRQKFSIYTAAKKNREIYRQILSNRELSELDYSDLLGKNIKDSRKKFLTPRYTHTNQNGTLEIPAGELRHNECHVQACLSNIRSIALTKDYDINNSNDLIELFQALVLKERLEEERKKTLQDPRAVLAEYQFYLNKSVELEQTIAFLNKKIEIYKKDRDNANADPQKYIFNQDLIEAFSRKKEKYPNFAGLENGSKYSIRNRFIWLDKNIAKLEEEVAALSEEQEKILKINEDGIRRKLAAPIKFEKYQKERAFLSKVDESVLNRDFLIQQLLSIYGREFKQGISDNSLLYKMISAQISVEVIFNFLYNISEAKQKKLLEYKSFQGLDLLNVAANNGYVEIAQFLLTNFPREFQVSKRVNGLLPIERAIKNDHANMVDFLGKDSIKHMADPLLLVIKHDAQNSAEIMFKNIGIWEKSFRQTKQDYFFSALTNGKFDLAKIMLKHRLIKIDGSNPFATLSYKEFLFDCCKMGNLAGANFILNNKIVSKGEHFDKNILTAAAESSAGSKMVKLLLDYDIKSSAKDIDSTKEILAIRQKIKEKSSALEEERNGVYLDAQEVLLDRSLTISSVDRLQGKQPDKSRSK